jgi:hypothetical protein
VAGYYSATRRHRAAAPLADYVSAASTLCPNCHRRADRGEIDRKSLRLYKINLRFAHDKFSQLEMDVLFELESMEDGHGMPWLGFQLILLKRAVDAGFISVHIINSGMSVNGIKSTPDMIAVTPKGRQFISELGLREL